MMSGRKEGEKGAKTESVSYVSADHEISLLLCFFDPCLN